MSFKGSKLAAPGVTINCGGWHYTAEHFYARLLCTEHMKMLVFWLASVRRAQVLMSHARHYNAQRQEARQYNHHNLSTPYAARFQLTVGLFYGVPILKFSNFPTRLFFFKGSYIFPILRFRLRRRKNLSLNTWLGQNDVKIAWRREGAWCIQKSSIA